MFLGLTKLRGGWWNISRSLAEQFRPLLAPDQFFCSSATDCRKRQKYGIPRPDSHPHYGVGGGKVSIGALVRLCEDGHMDEALKTMELAEQQDIRAFSTDRLYRLLQGCIKHKNLTFGRRVHSIIVEKGLDSRKFLGAHLIRMFAACGSLPEANHVFTKLSAPDVYAWAAIVSANAKHGQSSQALALYWQMRASSVTPNDYVYVAVLQACTSASALAEGKLIHSHVIQSACDSNVFVGSALIDMYSKCGRMEDARQVFDGLPAKNLIAWTAIIMGYVQHGDGHKALDLFKQMRRQGTQPDAMILSTILKACSSVIALDEGKLIHAYITEMRLELDVFLGTALTDMYAKCGSLEDARRVFDQLLTKCLASWNAMISGYVQHKNGHEALLLFQQMEKECVVPDQITLCNVLKACASIAALHQGKVIHDQMMRIGCEMDPYISSTLIDMYAKCGSLNDARMVFDRLSTRDPVIWTSMIAGYAQHGCVQEALLLFQKMQQDGVEPNGVTFVCLLSACSRAGLLHEGHRLLQLMSEDFGIIPEKEHYVCFIDLLCRAGHLLEAEDWIKRLPSQPDGGMWLPVLAACQTYVNPELGRRSFESIVRVDPTNAAAYVMMSNIYALTGMLEMKMEIRNQMQRAGVQKEPGRTWMELNNQVHTFVVEDQDHPERKQIYATLRKVADKVSEQSVNVTLANCW